MKTLLLLALSVWDLWKVGEAAIACPAEIVNGGGLSGISDLEVRNGCENKRFDVYGTSSDPDFSYIGHWPEGGLCDGRSPYGKWYKRVNGLYSKCSTDADCVQQVNGKCTLLSCEWCGGCGYTRCQPHAQSDCQRTWQVSGMTASQFAGQCMDLLSSTRSTSQRPASTTQHSVAAPGPIACTCLYGVAAPGSDCSDGFEKCNSCNHGYEMQGQRCVPMPCTCFGGEAAVGAACTVYGAEMCRRCLIGYTMVGNRCQGVPCTCAGGAAAVGTSCTSNGAEICVSCDIGFTLGSNSKCARNICSCSGGPPATGPSCPKHGQALCADIAKPKEEEEEESFFASSEFLIIVVTTILAALSGMGSLIMLWLRKKVLQTTRVQPGMTAVDNGDTPERTPAVVTIVGEPRVAMVPGDPCLLKSAANVLPEAVEGKFIQAQVPPTQ